jgi:hypothetical protein
MYFKNIFETGKPHLKKPVMINHHLVVFKQHDPGDLRGLYSKTFAKIESSLYGVDSIQTRKRSYVHPGQIDTRKRMLGRFK